jgi:hypothetical protein
MFLTKYIDIDAGFTFGHVTLLPFRAGLLPIIGSRERTQPDRLTVPPHHYAEGDTGYSAEELVPATLATGDDYYKNTEPKLGSGYGSVHQTIDPFLHLHFAHLRFHV